MSNSKRQQLWAFIWRPGPPLWLYLVFLLMFLVQMGITERWRSIAGRWEKIEHDCSDILYNLNLPK